MNYSQFSPVWIIDTLSEEGEEFDKRISQQLLAYSQNEIETPFDSETQRWWKVDRTKAYSNSLIDQNKHPHDIPAYSLTQNKLNETYLLVLVVGNLSEFEVADSIVKKLKELKESDSFMPGGGIKMNCYGLFSFESHQEFVGKWDDKINKSAFDTVFLQGGNNNPDSNTHGYASLNKKGEDRNFWDLSVQIIHHIIMTKDDLNRLNDCKIQIVGASSVIFEPEAERVSWATKLANAIVKKFKNDKQSNHWHNDKTANVSDTFAETHGWKNIYNELRGGYVDIPTDGLHVPSKVSPWRLFLKVLIKEYFRKYIKSLVRLLHGNVDGFSFVTTQRYKDHLDGKYVKLTGDGVLNQAIKEELCLIWDQKTNEEKDRSIGLQQFKTKLQRLKEFFVSQRESVDKLKNQSTPDSKNNGFPSIYDYPLGGFGDEYQKQYKKYIEKGEPSSGEKDNYGNSILQKLIRVLQFHPVPLSLIVRSFLLGILLPMCLLTVLRFIPDAVLNTSFLETGRGAIYFVCGCTIGCVLIGLLRYLFSVVDAIKVKIKDYIAWSLYKLQMLAYKMTLDKADDYFASAIKICEDIESGTAVFLEKDEELFDGECFKFSTNTFQSNVMKSFEGYAILKDNSIDRRYAVKTLNGTEVIKVETLTDEICYKVFRDVLVFSNDGLVLNALKNAIFTGADNSQLVGFENVLRDVIAKKLLVYVRNNEIKNLSDVFFFVGDSYVNGNDNMAIHKENGFVDSIAKYVKVNSYPAGKISGGYRYISYVIPDSDAFDERNWDGLFDWEHRCIRKNGANGISVLQGVAVERLSIIEDICIREDGGEDKAANSKQQ